MELDDGLGGEGSAGKPPKTGRKWFKRNSSKDDPAGDENASPKSREDRQDDTKDDLVHESDRAKERDDIEDKGESEEEEKDEDEDGEEDGKEDGKDDEEKDEEEEDEPIKYSINQWVAIILLFLGILVFILGIWMTNVTMMSVAVIFLIVGIPIFISEYLKMEPRKKKAVRRSILLLLRDVAIAFIIVGIILGSIMAYSQVWPPMVVVESDSMQHSETESFIGTIDTGDLVLVRNSPAKSDIITYVEGRARNYITYSDYGDVIVFRKDGNPNTTPIIHRAMIYLEFNTTTGFSFDIPSLEDLEYGEDWGFLTPPAGNDTSPFNVTIPFWIDDVGYNSVNVTINPVTFVTRVLATGGPANVYLTAGDHNLGIRGPYPDPWIVRQDWIIGTARGELPWFGLIKLTLFPESSGCCPDGWGDQGAPRNSWDSLLISLILIIAIPLILDFTIGFYLEKRAKRKKAEKRQKNGGRKDDAKDSVREKSDEGSDEEGD
jgi:signal peptidase